MSLQDEITAALKTAMLQRDQAALRCLRMLRTALTVKEKELRRPLKDEEVLATINSQIKQRRDSIDQYRQAGRQDLADSEAAEISVLQRFLPEQLSAAELEQAIGEIIAELGASSPKDLGLVMKAAMAKLAGRADGRTINQIVRAKLSA